MIVLSALLILGSGCATVDFDAEKSESYALTDTDDTYLGKFLSQFDHHPSHYSGFYIIPDGIDALAIRLLMELRAERSIDAQYYMVNDDIVGQLILERLGDQSLPVILDFAEDPQRRDEPGHVRPPLG